MLHAAESLFFSVSRSVRLDSKMTVILSWGINAMILRKPSRTQQDRHLRLKAQQVIAGHGKSRLTELLGIALMIVAMLTKQDFQQIERLLELKLDQKLEEKLEEKLNEKLRFFPTKDEFFKRMDEMMGELETIRNEQLLLTHSQEQYDRRIEKLETIHPKGKHVFASA